MVENFTQLSAQIFQQELSTGKYILLDCRTPEEGDIYGKISDDQILLDLNNHMTPSRVDVLDKKQPYLVYCWHGNRSQILRNYMQEQGFEFVCDLDGGIDKYS